LRWESPAWREHALAWIAAAAAEAGLRITGPVEDQRIKPWAAVLRVPTSDGNAYFKEPVPGLAFEARLIEVLARRRPELVTEVLVADEQGRMLMRDAGTQLSAILAEQRELRYWEEALPLYAELQIDAAPDAEELASVAFDRRTSLPASYEELLADQALMRVGDPDGVTADEYRQLCELAPEFAAACERLAAGRVPESIQNDDFTHGSIFVSNGSFRFVDWGDACVSHPFFTLAVTLRVVELVHELPPGSAELARVRDAYLEPFTRFEPRATLVPMADTARRVGQLCRAVMRADAERSGTNTEEPDALAWSLRLLLDPEIWRTFTD
jgi:hypothetical protein